MLHTSVFRVVIVSQHPEAIGKSSTKASLIIYQTTLFQILNDFNFQIFVVLNTTMEYDQVSW
jgi:hypothetical protein